MDWAASAAEIGPETADGAALHNRLMSVHQVLREDLAKVERLAGEVADDLPADKVREELSELKRNGPLWTLKVNCLQFCELLHGHHTGEDYNLFPRLRQLNPAIDPAITRLEREHAEVSELLDQIEDSAATLESDAGAAARSTTARLLTELRELLLAHLEFEELAAGPTILRLRGSLGG